MKLQTSAVLAISLVALLSGCNDRDQANSPTLQRSPGATRNQIEQIIARDSEVVLLSHNGIWFGKDDDLEMLLRSDGTAILTDHGFKVEITEAQYQITDDGGIVICPAGKSPWTKMPIEIENGDLLLQPPAKEQFFMEARQFGIPESSLTEKAYQESFEQWPLRQVRVSK